MSSSDVNTPNALTVGRIVLVPVFVVALLWPGTAGDVVAAVVFCVASATDFLDGWLARRQAVVTDFGKLADPIADKLLVASALLCLVVLDRLGWWVAAVVIAREVAVTVSRMRLARASNVVAAAWLGKVKTTVQLLVLLLLILLPGPPAWVEALVWLMVVLTVLSGLDYARAIRTAGRPATA